MKRPILGAARAVHNFKEALLVRRIYCADHEFFRMPDFWEWLCDDQGEWTVKTYCSDETEDFKRKAGVVAFGNRATLTVDEKLMKRARSGCQLSNFILAHEIGHLACNHHGRGAVTKNFQLFSGPSGMSNMPPTSEELEANYTGVFVQCGVALLDDRLDAVDLARRAYSDVNYVRKAQRLVRLEACQRQLTKQSITHPRVVL